MLPHLQFCSEDRFDTRPLSGLGKFNRAGPDATGPMQFCSSGGGFI